MTHWTMGGDTYAYLEPRRWTERDIELPWAARILAHAHGRVLEVGNATQHTMSYPPRTIIDRWDGAGGPMPVQRADIVDWDDGPYDLILSISTLEHVGTDPEEDQDAHKGIRAVERCVDLLAPGGELAFTVPCGYHQPLQDHVLACDWTDVRLMGRENQFSGWHELPLGQADCEFPFEWNSAQRVLFVRHRKP